MKADENVSDQIIILDGFAKAMGHLESAIASLFEDDIVVDDMDLLVGYIQEAREAALDGDQKQSRKLASQALKTAAQIMTDFSARVERKS